MATMRFNMTYHAQVERIDRLVACIQYIGVNEIIREQPMERHGRHGKRCLTDTGLILVMSDDNKLITGFMGTMAQVGSFFPGENIPVSLKKQTRKNIEKYGFLLKM